MTNKKPAKGRWYGYARVSFDEVKVKSIGMQSDLIEGKIEDLGGRAQEVFADEGVSGSKVSWRERKGFKRLLARLEPGDHLVVWRLDRLDRGPFGIAEALRVLASREVSVHSVEETDGRALNLGSLEGRILAYVFSMAAEMRAHQDKQATIQAMQYRRMKGFAYCGKVPIGCRRVTIKDPLDRKHHIKVDIYDAEEMLQVAEIWQRYRRGETVRSIANDFYDRREMTCNSLPGSRRQCRRLWCPMIGRPPKWRRPNDARIYAAIRDCEELTKRGLDPAVLAVQAASGTLIRNVDGDDAGRLSSLISAADPSSTTDPSCPG